MIIYMMKTEIIKLIHNLGKCASGNCCEISIFKENETGKLVSLMKGTDILEFRSSG